MKMLESFVVTKQSLPYLHFKASHLLEYEIPKAESITDFQFAYEKETTSLKTAIDHALTAYFDENPMIMLRDVIIVCGDVWAAKFVVTGNMNPTNLVLELPDYKEFRFMPALSSIWATIRSYRLSRTSRFAARS